MDKQKKIEYIEKLKKKYKNFETFVDKKGYDRITFNLGETEVPEEFKNNYLRVMPQALSPNKDKNYMIFSLVIGRNQKYKDEMQKQKESKRKKRQKITLEIKGYQKELRRATQFKDRQKISEIIDKIEKAEQEYQSLKIRKG